jgi:hypothetical protein
MVARSTVHPEGAGNIYNGIAGRLQMARYCDGCILF